MTPYKRTFRIGEPFNDLHEVVDWLEHKGWCYTSPTEGRPLGPSIISNWQLRDLRWRVKKGTLYRAEINK